MQRQGEERGAPAAPAREVVIRDLVTGVDPGFTGGLAAGTIGGQLLDVIRTPIIGKGGARQLDYDGLGYWCDLFGRRTALGCVEASHNYGGESPERAHRYGASREGVKSHLAYAGVRHFYEPEPNIWKPGMCLDDDKLKSVALALKLYPNAAQWIRAGVKADSGKAEAVLLYHLGRAIARRLFKL